ncbi:MAG: NUDIX hydrolase [Candidatus Saccharimonadales bacterium]
MKQLLALAGRAGYWLTWPALYVYMRGSHRSRMLLIHEQKVLVVKQWLGRNKWHLPGGGLHKGEDPLLGGIREVREEVGIALEPVQLQVICSLQKRSSGIPYTAEYYAAYLQQLPVPKLQVHEIRESGWISLDDAIAQNVVPASVVDALAASKKL